MLNLGIDPGASGGIAALRADGSIASLAKMPETDRDLVDAFKGFKSLDAHVFAMMERVNAGVFGRPGAKMGVVSAFTFGGAYRAIKVALTAADIPFDEVMPLKWQNALSCRSRGNKNITKARAQQLFPLVKVTHATADALLIAEYGRRLRLGVQHSAVAHQQEMFDGEEELDGEEAADAISEAFRRLQRKDEAREGAAQTATEGTAGDGEPRHRGDREGRARLRRRA